MITEYSMLLKWKVKYGTVGAPCWWNISDNIGIEKREKKIKWLFLAQLNRHHVTKPTVINEINEMAVTIYLFLVLVLQSDVWEAGEHFVHKVFPVSASVSNRSVTRLHPPGTLPAQLFVQSLQSALPAEAPRWGCSLEKKSNALSSGLQVTKASRCYVNSRPAWFAYWLGPGIVKYGNWVLKTECSATAALMVYHLKGPVCDF